MKHGLTTEEAKEYTQLGTEFDLNQISKEEKDILKDNFHAQIYAFRKLREKLLMSDNPADIYNTFKTEIYTSPPKAQDKRDKL